MLKKIAYVLLALAVLVVIAAAIVIRKFNKSLFKDRPNYLEYTYQEQPIPFQWVSDTIGDHIERHLAMIILVEIDELPHHQFYVQFDTGAPSTLLYGNPIESLKAQGVELNEIVIEEQSYIQQLDFTMGGNLISASTIKILEGYGRSFTAADTLRAIKLATIGADFLDDRITAIDFKNQSIQLYTKRPDWMATLPDFQAFNFSGRRFMLPSTIDGKELKLFYDSGSSAFGLITSKNRYKRHTDKSQEEICYNANRFGNKVPVCHRRTEKSLVIGNAHLPLERISYVNMYARLQGLMTPFTRVGGWLGNKPFVERMLILDTQEEEFLVLEGEIRR